MMSYIDTQITTTIKRPDLLEEAKQFIMHNVSPSNAAVLSSIDGEDKPSEIVLRFCENLFTAASALALHEVSMHMCNCLSK